MALSAEKPYLYCATLLGAVGVELWCGNRAEAQSGLTEARALLGPPGEGAARPLDLLRLWAGCLDMVLALGAGQMKVDVDSSLSGEPSWGSQYLDLLGTYHEELVSAGAIGRAEGGPGGWCTAEMLRVKGYFTCSDILASWSRRCC